MSRKGERLPDLRTIVDHWLAHPDDLEGIGDVALIDPGEPACFACGFRPYQGLIKWHHGANRHFDRAHLVNHDSGGPDTPDNLVPLCRSCHRLMSNAWFDNKRAALEWLRNFIPQRDHLVALAVMDTTGDPDVSTTALTIDYWTSLRYASHQIAGREAGSKAATDAA